MKSKLVLLVTIGCCLFLAGYAAGDAKDSLPAYDSPYYIIKSDLDKDSVQEINVRLTTMAQEYAARTAGFNGKISRKLPFYCFSTKEQYYAAGGMKGSAGCFTGGSLMAFAPAKGREAQLWHVLQHEGFHQFVHSVIRGGIPIWCNEGMAEYFGESVWTGDGFVVGIIPPGRLKRVKTMIKDDKVTPLLSMVEMSAKEWSSHLNISNYDQAWSMIHFLVHADNGKYQAALNGYISDISNHKPEKPTFMARFGRDTDAFKKSYTEWWNKQDDQPSKVLYAQATAATLNSFLARAWASGQKFQTFEEFMTAAKDGKLLNKTSQWLPQSLLEQAIKDSAKYSDWSLQMKGTRPELTLKLDEETTLTGSFVAMGLKVSKVEVKIVKPVKPKTPASKPAVGKSPAAK